MVLSMGLAVLAVPAPARAQWLKNEYQLQKAAAARYEPAALVSELASDGPVRPVRLRVYADEGYRAGGAGWGARFRRQIEDLNALLERWFAIRFEIEGLHRWERQEPSGSIEPMLKELERFDPARDVDWVVGLVTPLPLVETSFHHLGAARSGGRHFIVRGMPSQAEFDAFARAFKALDRDQREQLYERRKAHKERAVFLHEWAHTLGVGHVDDPTCIMAPTYSHHSARFTAADGRAILATLDERLEGRVERRPGDEAERLPRAPFHPATILPRGIAPDEAAAPARWRADAAPGRPPRAPQKGPAHVSEVRPEPVGRATLRDALRATPNAPALLILSCELALQEGHLATATTHCEKAASLRPGDASAPRLLGRIRLAHGDVDAALTLLRRAVDLDCHNLPLWEELAGVYRNAGRSREFQKFAAATPCPRR